MIVIFLLTKESMVNFYVARKDKIGYTFLDRSMRNVYNKNKEEQYA